MSQETEKSNPQRCGPAEFVEVLCDITSLSRSFKTDWLVVRPATIVIRAMAELS